MNINAISSVQNIMDNTSISSPSISLEDKVKELFAQYSATANQEKQQLLMDANTVDSSNPAQLLSLQNRLGNYALSMNMVSTLTHKSVSAIDTVLKAQ